MTIRPMWRLFTVRLFSRRKCGRKLRWRKTVRLYKWAKMYYLDKRTLFITNVPLIWISDLRDEIGVNVTSYLESLIVLVFYWGGAGIKGVKFSSCLQQRDAIMGAGNKISGFVGSQKRLKNAPVKLVVRMPRREVQISFAQL